MKIAYLALAVKRCDNNAGFTHPFNISRALSQQADVSLCISGRSPGVVRENCPRMVELSFPSTDSRTFSPLKIGESFRLMQRELSGTDVVHERLRYNPIDLLFVRDRKYVLEINDLTSLHTTSTWRSLKEKILSSKSRKCLAIITQTETLRNHIRNLTEKPVFIVPNGVDTGAFCPEAGDRFRKQYGIGEDEIVVTYVGSFRQWHGIPTILDTAEYILSQRRNITFILVGNGPLFDYAQRKAAGLRNVILTGSVAMDDIPRYVAGSDICVAPFSGENFGPIDRYGFWWCPVKLFEYLACGKPVVSSDYREVRKIVKDAALLSTPQDTRGFSKHILTLADTKQLREELGLRARSLSTENNSWDQRSELLLSVYDTLRG